MYDSSSVRFIRLFESLNNCPTGLVFKPIEKMQQNGVMRLSVKLCMTKKNIKTFPLNRQSYRYINRYHVTVVDFKRRCKQFSV